MLTLSGSATGPKLRMGGLSAQYISTVTVCPPVSLSGGLRGRNFRYRDSTRYPTMMDEDGGGVSHDLKDLETKLGQKAPESLVRFLTGGKHSDKWAAPHPASCKFCANSADLKRLESKMSLLKQEMANLRAIDVKLMQQLMAINEGIESIRWVIEDKGGVASQDGSLTGSTYSLSDSQDGTSLRGSFSSLNDGNGDGLDGLSVGSYLDTLEDLPDDPSPTGLDSFVDKTVVDGDAFTKSPLKARMESDEYYCFG